ncbi:RNA exonuclease 4 [Hyphodiscus hymeniophilus]|uniref:RNA exonuclease 4 n=1 Tax=Hyphodiscus hymeniophilus TaxID=353542 RepID=A0A9P6VDV7_9HELO|nr:RNA exonuclease 4 [Hyphodiscus hymeniophilus]
MAPELSSNWKRLQSTLKKESKTTEEKKRKAIPTERQQNTIAKRRRLEGKPVQAPLQKITKNKMGGMLGSQAVGLDQPTGTAPSASLALWAEDNDISAKDLAEAYGGSMTDTTIPGATADKVNGGLSADVEIGKYVGIDCEMVGVGGDENRSVLARVSIVNFHGTQVYDSFVRPREFVTDWRTHVSGVSTKDMATARSFEEVQAEIAAILKDRIIVGHGIKNDLEVMMLGHPKKDIRDTSKFSGFRKYSAGKTPSLKKLAKEILGVDIQGGEHSSIEDARATMLLFRRHKSAFDIEHAIRFPTHAPGSSSTRPKNKKRGKK